MINLKKDKINYKLLNILLFITIICLLFLIKDIWINLIKKLTEIIWPFIIAFAIAYALHPYKKKLEKKDVPPWLSTLIVLTSSIGLLFGLIITIGPLIYEQGLLFLSNIATFISNLTIKYNIELNIIQEAITKISTNILNNIGNQITIKILNFFISSVEIIATILITFFVSIYLLIDMDKIRIFIRKNLKNKQTLNYIEKLDFEIQNYFVGFFKNMLCQFIEYTSIFFIIGHPNFLIFGILASVSNIIPYFGGIITNIIFVIISSVISPNLTMWTLLICIICPQIDAYILAPKIYHKTNNIHPLINIFAIFTGSILFGFWGLVIAEPIAVIILTTYKYYKKDIKIIKKLKK